MEVKKLEELFKSTQGLESLGQKLNRCTNELKWAYVNEIEQVILCACMSVCVCVCVRVRVHGSGCTVLGVVRYVILLIYAVTG